jgi:hypothetical protein
MHHGVLPQVLGDTAVSREARDLSSRRVPQH